MTIEELWRRHHFTDGRMLELCLVFEGNLKVENTIILEIAFMNHPPIIDYEDESVILKFGSCEVDFSGKLPASNLLQNMVLTKLDNGLFYLSINQANSNEKLVLTSKTLTLIEIYRDDVYTEGAGNTVIEIS